MANDSTYSWPRKSCPCGGYMKLACQEGGCEWQNDPALVPEDLRIATPPAATPAAPGDAEILEVLTAWHHDERRGPTPDKEAVSKLRQLFLSCPAPVAAQPAGQEQAGAMALLAAKHTGMRVDYSGLLKQAQAGLRREPALAEMLRQLKGHLAELGRRWYAGDTAVVDEILQLYCIEKDARDALAATGAAIGAPVAAPAPASEAVAQSITLDFKQATELLEMFGDQPREITLTAYPKDEHHFEEGFSIAAGLYAHCTDCPEEGSNYLGVPDYDAIPAGDSADAPVQQREPVAWLAENQDGSFDAYKEVHALIDDCRQGFPVYRAVLRQETEAMQMLWDDQAPEEKAHYLGVVNRAALKGEQPAVFDGLICLSDAQAALLAKDAECEVLRGALLKIARWELPATGKFWDDEKTRPTSYEAEYGSNGARAYMRALALAAIDSALLAAKEAK